MIGFQNPLLQSSQDDLRHFVLDKNKSTLAARDLSGLNNSLSACQPPQQLEWRYSFNPLRDSEQPRNMEEMRLNLVDIEKILSEETDNSAVNDSLFSPFCSSGKQNRTREFCKTSESFATTPTRCENLMNRFILPAQASIENLQTDGDLTNLQAFSRKKDRSDAIPARYNLIRSPIKEKFDLTSNDLDLENYDPSKDQYLNRLQYNGSIIGNDSMMDNSMYRILSQKHLGQSPKPGEGEELFKAEPNQTKEGTLPICFQRETFGCQNENIPPINHEQALRECQGEADYRAYGQSRSGNLGYNSQILELKRSFHKILFKEESGSAWSKQAQAYSESHQGSDKRTISVINDILNREQGSLVSERENIRSLREREMQRSKDCLKEIQEREEKFFKDLDRLREEMNRVKAAPLVGARETRESKFQTFDRLQSSPLPQIIEERSSILQKSSEDLQQISKCEGEESSRGNPELFRGSLTKSEENNFWNNSSENLFQQCNLASVHSSRMEESMREVEESCERRSRSEFMEVRGSVPDFTKKKGEACGNAAGSNENNKILVSVGENPGADTSLTSIDDSAIIWNGDSRVPPLFESKTASVFLANFTSPFKKDLAKEIEVIHADSRTSDNKMLNKEAIDELIILSEKLERTVKKNKREKSRTPERRNIFRTDFQGSNFKGRFSVTVEEPAAVKSDKLSKSTCLQTVGGWEDLKKNSRSYNKKTDVSRNENIISEMRPETEEEENDYEGNYERAQNSYTLTSFENPRLQESIRTSQIIQNNQERQYQAQMGNLDDYQFLDTLRKKYDISYSASQYNFSYEVQSQNAKNSLFLKENCPDISRETKLSERPGRKLLTTESGLIEKEKRKSPGRIFTNQDFKEVFAIMEQKYNYKIDNFQTEGESLIKEVFCMDCEDYIKKKEVDSHSNVCYQSLCKEIHGYWTLTAEEKKKRASSDDVINEVNVKLRKIKAMIEEKLSQLGGGVDFAEEINKLLQIGENVISNQFFSKQIFLNLTEIDSISSFLNSLKDKRVTVNFIILTNRLKHLCKEKAVKLKDIEDQVLAKMSVYIEENEEVAPSKTESSHPQPGKVMARIKLPKKIARNALQSLTAIHSDSEFTESKYFSCSEATNNSATEPEFPKQTTGSKIEIKISKDPEIETSRFKDSSKVLLAQQNQENGKREFYAEAVRIKLGLPRQHPGRDILISNLYDECLKLGLKRREWQDFIKEKYKSCE